MTRVKLAKSWFDDYRARYPERTLEMARLYVEERLSYAQIAERYGITRQRVGHLLKPLGLARDLTPQRREDREKELRKASERIEKGKATASQEAERLGYANVTSFRSQLARLGLKPHYPRPTPKHGTVARYRSGCHCWRCRNANAEVVREAYKERTSTPEGKEAERVRARARRAARRQRKEVVS